MKDSVTGRLARGDGESYEISDRVVCCGQSCRSMTECIMGLRRQGRKRLLLADMYLPYSLSLSLSLVSGHGRLRTVVRRHTQLTRWEINGRPAFAVSVEWDMRGLRSMPGRSRPTLRSLARIESFTRPTLFHKVSTTNTWTKRWLRMYKNENNITEH